MGHIHKVNETYYIEFSARGLIYSQPAGTDEGLARKMLEQVELKIAQGEALTIVREIDLQVFFEQFSTFARERYSLKSIGRFIKTWRHWSDFISKSYPEVERISQITPAIVESYKAFLIKDFKPKIINFTVLLLREILEHAIKMGLLNDNPTLHVRLLEIPQYPLIHGRRYYLAKDLLLRGLSFGKVCQLLKLKDIAQIMYWSEFIPLKRDDVYI